MAEFTADSITTDLWFDGQLTIHQPARGYRHAMDPVILCSHITPKPGTRILDIGCGCGIMPLILGFKYPQTDIIGVEIQPELARIAQLNCRNNALDHQIQILDKDINKVCASDLGQSIDLVITNPPFRKRNSGRLNPDRQKALAHHELTLTLDQVISKARELLKPEGSITIIFPSDRLQELRNTLARHQFSPVWIRFIHPNAKKKAIRVLICASQNTPEFCTTCPPLHMDTWNKNQENFQTHQNNP